jgi:hypothetical protein
MPCVLLDRLHMQQVLNMLCMQLMDADKPLSLLLQDSDWALCCCPLSAGEAQHHGVLAFVSCPDSHADAVSVARPARRRRRAPSVAGDAARWCARLRAHHACWARGWARQRRVCPSWAGEHATRGVHNNSVHNTTGLAATSTHKSSIVRVKHGKVDGNERVAWCRSAQRPADSPATG